MSLTVGSLFAGIGGFDVAAERVGFTVKWQVEIDDYATRVLEKHWPGVRRYRDINDCCGSVLRAERVTVNGHEDGRCAECGRRHWLPHVDVICGGFPCQPVSLAGKRRAQNDARWLWPDFARIIGELEPRYVVVENVPGLFTAGFDRVLGDLASLGFDAEWECLPASAFGAPHIRERVWLVAYPGCERQQERGERDSEPTPRREIQSRNDARGRGPHVADSNGSGPQKRFVFGGVSGKTRRDDDGQDAAVGGRWPPEPDVGRVAHGIPARVDRLRGLGNAIVPQVAEWIFQRIKEAEGLDEAHPVTEGPAGMLADTESRK